MPKKKTTPTKKPVPKWQVVENVVAAIESVRSNVPGMKLTQKAMVPLRQDPSRRREVDVLVEIPAGDRLLRIGVEVKNEKKPLDEVMVEQLGAKAQKLVVDRYCVVSTSGFTPNGEDEAKRVGVELATLEELRESDFWWHRGMRVVRRQFELLDVAFEYDDPESVAHHFADCVETDITVLGADGTSQSIRTFAVGHGIKAAHDHQVDLADGEGVTVLLSIEGDYLDFQVAGKPIPRPNRLRLTFRSHVSAEMIQDRRFRLGEIEAVTHELDMFGDARQVTLTSAPASGELGSARQLAVTIGRGKPKRTKV